MSNDFWGNSGQTAFQAAAQREPERGAQAAARTTTPGSSTTAGATAPVANAGTEGEIYQNVNEATDTVFGQLQKHTDFSSPVMQRVAQRARDRVGARGMTNSSIAIGNATGAVVDQAGKFATEDARIYNERKTENQRAETHIRDANIRAAATVSAAQISAGATLGAARINADTSVRLQAMQDENRVQLQRMSDRSQMQRLRVDTRSRQSVAKMEIEARSYDAEMDRQSRERQTQISADNQQGIARFQQESQNDRQKAEMYDNIWRDYNQGVMNIDINASAASQREQLTRLNDTARIRLESQGYIDSAVNDTPPPVPYNGPMNPTVMPGQTVFGGTSFGGARSSFTPSWAWMR